LREKLRLRTLEISVLRKMCGAKKDGAVSEWRILHNEEIDDLYYLPKVFRAIK
jgi:hypothetical protein